MYSHTWRDCDVHVILTDGTVVHATCGDVYVRNDNVCIQTTYYDTEQKKVTRFVSPIMLITTQMMWLNHDLQCTCAHTNFSKLLGVLHVFGATGPITFITKQANCIYRILCTGSPKKE
jgi:hypothetical protein